MCNLHFGRPSFTPFVPINSVDFPKHDVLKRVGLGGTAF